MLDTYNDWNPKNPINEIEIEFEEVEVEGTTLYSAVNECNDEIIDLYFNHIESQLQNLIDFSKGTDNTWLAGCLEDIKKQLK